MNEVSPPLLSSSSVVLPDILFTYKSPLALMSPLEVIFPCVKKSPLAVISPGKITRPDVSKSVNLPSDDILCRDAPNAIPVLTLKLLAIVFVVKVPLSV